MSIVDKFQNKRVLIWGYGREGKSTERFLKEKCSPLKVDILEGKKEDVREDEYDFIIKSPGIPELHLGAKYTSQTELFMEEFGGQVIGVTGTKGKSTTSSLLYQTLKETYDKPVILAGNIGLPCLDFYDEITKDTAIVFELSCHQLADCKVSPHIGVFLNLYEEHLDYYKVMDEYFRAKCNVGANQRSEDVLYVGKQVPEFVTGGQKTVITYGEEQDYHLQIPGEHNNYNAEFVYRILTEQFQCSGEAVKKAMKKFTGLPHRLQKVATVSGVTFYDDSISTIPEAAIAAGNSIPKVKTMILGGMDRHIDYKILEDYIQARKDITFLLAYETGKRIFGELKETDNCRMVENLKEAVMLAKQITPPDSSCVMSPAAASYGYFKNFEERGEFFQSCVTE